MRNILRRTDDQPEGPTVQRNDPKKPWQFLRLQDLLHFAFNLTGIINKGKYAL
jgi:hypothetical protein